VLALLLLVGCATPQGVGGPAGQGAPDQQIRNQGTTRITLAFRGVPATFREDLNRTAGAQSVSDLQELMHVGLANEQELRELHAELAESLPTVDNGGWRLFADGRMETTWKIRRGAQWHDGTPFTADDVIFASQVAQDPALPFPRDPGYRSVEGIDAPDPQTIVIRWKEPYIEADRLFGTRLLPLPKHLLEEQYTDNQANFAQLPYWTSDFVGTGPFQVKSYERDSFVVLAANPGFVLGRPRIDEITVRFIGDANAAIAAALAGEIDLTLRRVVSLEQGVQVRDQWTSGRLDVRASGSLVFYPQFINPSPQIVGDVRLREAVYRAIDRKQIVESLLFGVTQPADTFLSPDFAGYQDIDGQVLKYPYDTRRSIELLGELGYSRGSDGIVRDATGQRPSFEIRSTNDDLNSRTMLAVADYWTQLGLGVDPLVIPTQRANDGEYGSTFPAFFLNRQRNDLQNMRNFRGSETPLPENNFVGQNRARYRNAELGALIDRYFITIPSRERMQVVGQILHIQTQDLTIMSILYAADAELVSNRLHNARAVTVDPTWNAYEWEVA
jgi:peptide/nickel transport system substrate-binding protein